MATRLEQADVENIDHTPLPRSDRFRFFGKKSRMGGSRSLTAVPETLPDGRLSESLAGYFPIVGIDAVATAKSRSSVAVTRIRPAACAGRDGREAKTD
jgi:hypothetical protein